MNDQREVLAILQARMSSVRLPGKVLMKVNGLPMLQRQIERIKNSKKISKLIVATSRSKDDLPIIELCKELGVESFAGSLDNVLERFLAVESKFPHEVIVRLTGDCPLFMADLCDEMIEKFLESTFDYYSNTIARTYPDGLDIEIFKSAALRELEKLKPTSLEQEHVTLGIYTRPNKFACGNHANKVDFSKLRWTVDTEEDLHFVRSVFSGFIGDESIFDFHDVFDFISKDPNWNILDMGSLRNSALIERMRKFDD